MLSRSNTLASSANIRQAIANKLPPKSFRNLNLLDFNPKKYVTKDLRVMDIALLYNRKMTFFK